MRGIWQILVGTTLIVWEFAHLGHGFWQRQTRYRSYEPNWVSPTVNTLTILIYAIGAGLICFGIYRLLRASSRPYRRPA